MDTRATDIKWQGEYPFRLSGSGLHEDTLRIDSNDRRQEHLLKLVLPTLCITYADAAFQDAIGGEQENYPASRAYGPAHFTPPVEILGQEKIEKFTYIRGAQRVEIGPDETVIEFPSWRDLVIPRLRLDTKDPAEAVLRVPESRIQVDEPLRITARQLADGRHVGGVRLEKRHPEWQPDVKEAHSLWIRVIEGLTRKPVREVRVDVWRWNDASRTAYGTGGFVLYDSRYTGGDGCIEIPQMPSGELEAYVVHRPGWRATVRCLRPLAGQKVRLHMRLWPLKRDKERVVWRGGDDLDVVARRAGLSAAEVLEHNRLKQTFVPRIGRRIDLPYYAAVYHLELWDTLEWVAETFGYRDLEALAAAGGFLDAAELEGATEIRLPDWRFYTAQENDSLERFDSMLGLPEGSSITVGRVHHPDSRLPYAGETVAAPTPRFAEGLRRESRR